MPQPRAVRTISGIPALEAIQRLAGRKNTECVLRPPTGHCASWVYRKHIRVRGVLFYVIHTKSIYRGEGAYAKYLRTTGNPRVPVEKEVSKGVAIMVDARDEDHQVKAAYFLTRRLYRAMFPNYKGTIPLDELKTRRWKDRKGRKGLQRCVQQLLRKRKKKCRRRAHK